MSSRDKDEEKKQAGKDLEEKVKESFNEEQKFCGANDIGRKVGREDLDLSKEDFVKVT